MSTTSSLRDRYYHKEIFNIGDIVESDGTKYRIKKRGANHVIVESMVDKSIVLTKWINDIQESTPDDVNESQMNIARIIARALSFPNILEYRNPIALIEDAIDFSLTDDSFQYYNETVIKLIEFASKSGIILNEKYLSEDLWSSDVVMKYEKDADGNLIRDEKGLPKMRKHRKEKIDFRGSISGGRPKPIEHNKTKRPTDKLHQQKESRNMETTQESVSDILSEIATATLLGKDTSSLKSKLKDVKYAIDKRNLIDRTNFFKDTGQEDYGIEDNTDNENNPHAPEQIQRNGHHNSHIGSSLVNPTDSNYIRKQKVKQVSEGLADEDNDNLTSKELADLESQVNDFEDIHDVYHPDELAVIDKDTGEKVKDIHEEYEAINEVLSRSERIRSSMRFARMHSKLERKMMIAIKRRSSSSVLNHRATKLAEKLIKTKLAGGRAPDTLDVSTKERIEAIMQRKRNSVKQLAMRLVSKIRKIENDRLTHHTFTKD